MIKVTHQCQANLSAEVVWAELRHFDRVLRWIPGGDTSRLTVQGSGVGAIRDIHLSTQGYVQHRLVAYDAEAMTFAYELTAGKPIGMQDYCVVAKVTPIDASTCNISWAGEMTADASLDEAATGQALEVALANMTRGIIALLTGESPEFTQQPNEDWQLQQTPHSE